jgi:hypothetical protein
VGFFSINCLYYSTTMAKLEPHEQNYIRSFTKELIPKEMAEVYDNAHRKNYFELVEAATRIRETKEGNAADMQAPREVAMPIAMGQASTRGAAEGSGSAGRLEGEYSLRLSTFAD